MTHTEWVDWWLQTDFGMKKKIHWDSSHQAEIWSKFDQVAHAIDGAPKVMCKNCGQILEHPYILHTRAADQKAQYHGTSSMSKHIKSAACQKAKRGPTAEITKFLKKVVRSLEFLRLAIPEFSRITIRPWLLSHKKCGKRRFYHSYL